jgi:hypothetical protein
MKFDDFDGRRWTRRIIIEDIIVFGLISAALYCLISPIL